MMKRLFAILLALAMLLSLTVVFAEDEAEDAAAEAIPDTLLVTVNGEEIRQNDETLQYYYTSLLTELGDPEEGNPDDAEALHVARMYAMSYAIQIRLVNQKASEFFTEEDYEAFREQVRAEWNEIVEEFMTDFGITEESSEEDRIAARADVLNYLETYYGYTEERYVTEGVENLAFNSVLEKVASDLKAADPTLAASDEEIEQLYNEYVTEEMEYIGNDVYTYELYQIYGYQFHYIPEGYRGITHILLEVDQELLDAWADLANRLEESEAAEESVGDGTEAAETVEPVTAEMVEEARQAIIASQQNKIDEIMKRLEEGAVFEDLIPEYSIDPGPADEDYLHNGYSVHPDSISYVAPFTQGAAALEKVGDVSEPIVSSYGIHILHYLRDIEGGALEMSEEVRETLRSEIEDERVNLVVSEEIDRWQAEADIVWTEEGKAWEFDQEAIDAFNAARAAAAAAESGEAAEPEEAEEPEEATEEAAQ